MTKTKELPDVVMDDVYECCGVPCPFDGFCEDGEGPCEDCDDDCPCVTETDE